MENEVRTEQKGMICKETYWKKMLRKEDLKDDPDVDKERKINK